MNPVENIIIKAEVSLSLVSGIPVIGTAAGACKIAMGTLQSVTALALAILSVLPALIPIDNNPMRTLFIFSCRHVVHGAGNVIAGVVEATPIIQTLFLFIRATQAEKGSYRGPWGRSEQDGMFMRYNEDVKPGYQLITV